MCKQWYCKYSFITVKLSTCLKYEHDMNKTAKHDM